MAHPVLWPTKTFFYPVGNTSPVSLLQHVPPEDSADILLLGCGDPRNILYTIHAYGIDQPAVKRKLDFTCCDIEPAIIARNLLLFTLVADGYHVQQPQILWNIFYHFLLDDTSLALLLAQVRKLANLSLCLDAWNASEYSRFLEVGNRFTLGELHRHWTLYTETATFSSARKKKFKEKFVSGMKEILKERVAFADATAARSAGPVAFLAISTGTEALCSFWKSGTTFTSQRDIDAASLVNPTFAYATSGEGFVAHYGTNILAAFHLAPVFATADIAKPVPLSEVYGAVRAQFRSWCEAFHACIRGSADKIKIRVVVADVLAFCQALQITRAKGDPTVFPRSSTWRAPLLTLDGMGYATASAPLSFDAIDTSNLCDHIGTLNILVATAPLLKQSPTAALYTETLLSSGEDPMVSFTDSLCGDVTAMSLLFDLAPTSYVAGYSTQSNVHEVISFQMQEGTSTQYHERLIWKIPSQLSNGGCRPVAVDAPQLAAFLFKIYQQMLSHENFADLVQMKFTLASIKSRDRVHYCRRSFAELVRTLMAKVSVDWSDVMKRIENHIVGDKTLLLGVNFYQDLLTQLHLLGIYSAETYVAGNPLLSMNKEISRFRDWSSVPPVVCVSFVVPRSRLQVLEEEEAPATPVLAVDIGSLAVAGTFLSIEAMFGTLTIEGDGAEATASVTEDPLGKSGTSSVVVSVCVPAWVLAHDPRTMMVRLRIVSTPSTSQLSSKLGYQLVLYEAPLSDQKLVYVLRGRPSVAGHCASIPYLPKGPQPPASAPITLSTDGTKVEKLTRRIEINEHKAKAALALKEIPVTVQQAGACELELSIGSASRTKLAFPFSVESSLAKLRVARQSAWVEVVATPSSLGQSGSAIENRFPVAMHVKTIIPWAIHRLYLDRLPVLSAVNVPKDRLEWVNTHLSLAFSDREKLARQTETMEPITHVKDSIHSIFVQTVGIQGPKKTGLFGLHRTSEGGIDTLLFVTDIRFDVATHALVADAFVLPLHKSFLHKIWPHLGDLRDLCQVKVSDEECIAWKCLLPSFVERCRTWEHKPNCAYVVHRKIPLSTAHSEVPICDCGKGKVTDAFRHRKEWSPFLPYVTRAAISPLFAVSFLESVAGNLKNLLGLADAGTAARYRAAGSASVSSDGQQAGLSRCGACKTVLSAERPMICSRCKKVAYCSRDCQTKDWKAHKQSCKAT